MDEVVERGLRVEHHGVEGGGGEARRLEGLVRHPARLVGEGLEAQGVGQPLGGVDGHHNGLPAPQRPFQGDRGGDRRLPDATAPGADDDLAVESGFETHEGLTGPPAPR